MRPEQDIEGLTMKVEELSRSLSELKEEVKKGGKKMIDDYSFQEKDALAEVVGDSIIDIVWNKMFHFFTFFESLDGWSLSDSSSGSVSGAFAGGVQLRTDASGGTETFIIKNPSYQNVLTFDRPSRFRTAFYVASGAGAVGGEEADNELAYIGHGNGYTASAGGLDPQTSQYGFVAIDNILYGITGDGKSMTKTILKKNFNYYDLYEVEARYFPGERVDFYVSDPVPTLGVIPSEFKAKFITSITTTLPNKKEVPSLMRYQIVTADSAYREMMFTFFEYIQNK